MSIAFVVLKLEGGQIDPPQGVAGSRNSQGGIWLKIDNHHLYSPFRLHTHEQTVLSSVSVDAFLCGEFGNPGVHALCPFQDSQY